MNLNTKKNIRSACSNNKKTSFTEKKNNTIKSLSEVEHFLRNIKKLKNCINLYNILK